MPIPLWWNTGRHGVRFKRPNQQVGDRVHTLSQAECGELQDSVEVVRDGARVRGGDSEG